MTSKKVSRFKCDHCGKTGYSASHMARHERSCTKNPKRVCRVCKMVEGDQKPIDDLLSILPKRPRTYYEPKRYIDEDGAYCGLSENDQKRIELEIAACIPLLREATKDCPACMMAALRQANIPMYMAKDFDFTKEMKHIWDGINDANSDRYSY